MPLRKTLISLSLIAITALPGAGAAQSNGEALTKQECSACHMAYQSWFLPKRSWTEIMATLPDHFGEDASLPEADRAAIEAYLLSGAADRNGRMPRWLKAVPADVAPLRITELSWYLHEHGSRLQARAKSDPAIGTLSNCVACHKGAERGYFED